MVLPQEYSDTVLSSSWYLSIRVALKKGSNIDDENAFFPEKNRRTTETIRATKMKCRIEKLKQ